MAGPTGGRYRRRRLVSQRSKAAIASDAATNTQKTQLTSRTNNATSAATTQMIDAICRCRLVQATSQPAYRPLRQPGGFEGRNVVGPIPRTDDLVVLEADQGAPVRVDLDATGRPSYVDAPEYDEIFTAPASFVNVESILGPRRPKSSRPLEPRRLARNAAQRPPRRRSIASSSLSHPRAARSRTGMARGLG